MSVVGWTFFTGGLGWLEVHFWRVGMGGHFFIGGRGCLGLGEGIFWVNGGGWTFFMGG